MKRAIIGILVGAILILAGCPAGSPSQTTSPTAMNTLPLDLGVVSTWGPEQSSVHPAVAAAIKGKDYLFVGLQPNSSQDDNLLAILDVTDPYSPVEIAHLVTPEPFPIYSLVLSGTMLYAKLMNSLWIVDVSEPENPRQMSELKDSASPSNIVLAGGYIYSNIPQISGGTSIQVIDVSDPTNPAIAATVPVSAEAIIRAASGNRLYCTGQDGLRIFDISSPLAPRQIGFYASPIGPAADTGNDWDLMVGFMDISVSGNYAFIASGLSGLRVLDIGDPANIKEVALTNPGDISMSLSIYGNTAFLAGVNREPFRFEVLAVDITQPDNPQGTGSIEVPAFSIYRPVRLGDYIYVTGMNLTVIGLYAKNG